MVLVLSSLIPTMKSEGFYSISPVRVQGLVRIIIFPNTSEVLNCSERYYTHGKLGLCKV